MRFRDAFLTLLRLLPMRMPLIFLDFAFRFGMANDGSIGRHSMLLCFRRLVVHCGTRGGSSTSMMAGMGTLLRVTRWWINFVPLITLGDVGLFDDDAVRSTLCGALVSTL